MLTAIITGSTGFVGKNLLSFVQEKEISVKVLSLRNNYLKLPGGDAVLHLAGKAHDLKNTSKPKEYYEVNYELTKKLYNLFLASDSRKFIFISSVKAIADSINAVLTEEETPKPQTHYGKSKLMAEEYIRNQPLPEGKSYYILRPCMIHGPGNKGNLNLLYNFVSRGIPYPLAAFDNKRSFLSIENLCFIIKEILERDDIPSGIYNVSDDEALSTVEVVSLLSEALKKRPVLWSLPVSLVKFIAKLGDGLQLPLNSERLGKLTENYVVSNAKIKRALRKDLPVSAREGILKTADFFKNL